MNTPAHLPAPGQAEPSVELPPTENPTSVRIIVNGRTVLHRHFLQQAMDAMVRRALAEEALAGPH